MEHEYERGGALQYLATWDVQAGVVMGRCKEKTWIEPFGRLIEQVMVQRKVLTPNDFIDLAEVELRLRLYEELTNRQPCPFNWKFTKYDLFNLLQRLASKARSRPGSALPTEFGQ